MKKMLFYAVGLCIALQSAHGAERYNEKSFRVVLKLCGKCHGIPFYMAKQKDEDEWAEYFESDEKLLD